MFIMYFSSSQRTDDNVDPSYPGSSRDPETIISTFDQNKCFFCDCSTEINVRHPERMGKVYTVNSASVKERLITLMTERTDEKVLRF